jgi:hypothetical protein
MLIRRVEIDYRSEGKSICIAPLNLDFYIGIGVLILNMKFCSNSSLLYYIHVTVSSISPAEHPKPLSNKH